MQRSIHDDDRLVTELQVLVSNQVTVDYTLREVRPGEWLALGSVRNLEHQYRFSDRIIVGMGHSDSEALGQIEMNLQGNAGD